MPRSAKAASKKSGLPRGIQFRKKVLSGILRKFYVFQGVSKVHNTEILPNHGTISFYRTLPGLDQCELATLC